MIDGSTSYQHDQAIDWSEQSKTDLTQLVEWFEESESQSVTSRTNSKRDRDYYDGNQLTEAELQVLRKRGQPDVVTNRIQAKINYMLGYEASQRMDPKGVPRNPTDEDAAQACTDALRYVSESTDMDQWLSQVWENMLVEGFGALEVNVEQLEDGDAEISLTAWHWDRLFYDPYSRMHDFRDARYYGGVLWLDYNEALRRWPDSSEALEATLSESIGAYYQDKPDYGQWVSSGKRKRVRIVQMWYKEGDDWHFCIFTKGGKLENSPLPFRDKKGKSYSNMLMQSAFVSQENDRYGYVRSMVSPQDEINRRRSRALHLIGSNRYFYEKGALGDPNAIKAALKKSDALIEVNPGFKFDRIPDGGEESSNLALLQEAKGEIDKMGPNASMQGEGASGASGRAIARNQQGGQIEMYRVFDRYIHLKRRLYRLIWIMIRQYWTSEKWVRVTDDEKNLRFVGFNHKVTLFDDLMVKAEENGVPKDQAESQIRERVQQNPFLTDKLQQVVRVENVPADMDMDILLEEIPDVANVQEEQFQILANLASAGIQFPPKVYIQASGLRDKKKLLDMLEDASNDPANEAAGKAQMDKLQAEIEKLRADAGLSQAKSKEVEANSLDAITLADQRDGFTGQIITPEVIPNQSQQQQQRQQQIQSDDQQIIGQE